METLETRLYQFIKEHPGMRARLIAAYLNVDKTTINRILYQKIGTTFSQDSNWGWSINGANNKMHESDNIQIVSLINTIHSIFKLMFEQDDDFFSIDGVESIKTEATYLYFIDDAITHFYFDLAMDEDDYEYIEEDVFQEYVHEYEAILSRYVEFSNYEDKFKGFYTRENKVPVLFSHVSDFDTKYRTSYALILVDCFRLLGEAILLTLDISETNGMKLKDHIRELHEYVLSRFGNYLVRCDICQEVAIRGDCHLMKHDLICDDCYDQMNSDEDEDTDGYDDVTEDEEDEDLTTENEATSEEIDYKESENVNQIYSSKSDILEDCKTCKRKLRCPKAKFNLVCENYEYFKDPFDQGR